jgi:hypothetical protein
MPDTPRVRLGQRRKSEFLAQRPACDVVDAHGLADISVYGESVHEHAAALTQRRAFDQAPGGAFGAA